MNDVLDTNVLAPYRMRDVLLTLAAAGLFSPVWSDIILAELDRVLRRPPFDQSAGWITHLFASLSSTFQDATIAVDRTLMATLWLPDPDDRHVLAAAIQTSANIVTFNVRHFPPETLRQHSVRVVTPNEFLGQLLDREPDWVVDALTKRAARLSRPKLTVAEFVRGIEPQAPTFVRACLPLL